MKITRISQILVLSLAALNLAHAQSNYPSKPITVVVPYGAGGSADSRSRQLAHRMSVMLKQPWCWRQYWY